MGKLDSYVICRCSLLGKHLQNRVPDERKRKGWPWSKLEPLSSLSLVLCSTTVCFHNLTYSHKTLPEGKHYTDRSTFVLIFLVFLNLNLLCWIWFWQRMKDKRYHPPRYHKWAPTVSVFQDSALLLDTWKFELCFVRIWCAWFEPCIWHFKMDFYNV